MTYSHGQGAIEIDAAHLSKVPRMVLVHHNPVMVLSTSISTSSRMLPVLSNTSMTSTDVPALLPVLPQTCSGRASPKGTASDIRMLKHE